MRWFLLLCAFGLVSACRAATPDYGRALPDGAPALLPLGPGEAPPDFSEAWSSRDELLPALDRSITWTRRRHAQGFFPAAGITHERALASLERFRELLLSSPSSDAFRNAIGAEFAIYKSAGWDGRGGGVLFTGYCTPIVNGSRTRDGLYRHPLYALPDDLVKAPDGSVEGWKTASGLLAEYPSRRAIEAGALLEGRGLELVWLADPIDAYITHVNGSAVVRLRDGELIRLGYAGKNGRPYSSLGRELILDGVLEPDRVSLRAIRAWAAETPEETVLEYLGRNESYVFFTPIDGGPHGSLDVPVTPERSVATDKSLFPRGAVVFVSCEIDGRPFEQVFLDQDTGGAIRTAGRADLYLGVGDEAEERSGRVRSPGQMYYAFLRE